MSDSGQAVRSWWLLTGPRAPVRLSTVGSTLLRLPTSATWSIPMGPAMPSHVDSLTGG